MRNAITLDNYFSIMRILATIAIFTTGFLESVYNPGTLDLCNAASLALVVYALWFASIRKPT